MKFGYRSCAKWQFEANVVIMSDLWFQKVNLRIQAYECVKQILTGHNSIMKHDWMKKEDNLVQGLSFGMFEVKKYKK